MKALPLKRLRLDHPLMAEAYLFGDFVHEVGERRLRRQGDVIPLAPNAFDLLVSLVRHAGRLIGKQELLEDVWDCLRGDPRFDSNASACRRRPGVPASPRRAEQSVWRRTLPSAPRVEA